jgi:2-dehydropantoate 2-reductase
LLDGPGAVRAFADLPSYIGEIAGGISERASGIAELLSQAGLRVVASQDILREKWSKLLVNIAFAATSGTTGLTLGEVIQHPELASVARTAMEEAAGVASAKGIVLDPAARVAIFDQILSGEAKNNKASVLADLTAGRPSEVDYIYGTVIRYADELGGVPVPTLRALSALIKGREEASRRPYAVAA